MEPADDPNALVSQTAVLNLFGEGVVYHSAAFSDFTEISGFPRLTLWLSMNVPDTDLYANLYEILPDGGSVQLTGRAVASAISRFAARTHARACGQR